MKRPPGSRQDPRLFFTALALSAFGYEFIFFIMTVHLYDLSKSALSIGVFTTLTFVPRLFSSLMGGLADRFGKGRCFSWSALAVTVLLFMMSRTSDIGQIDAIWFVMSFFLTFVVNTRGSLMAEIVASEHYASGNALSLALLNGAKLVGPLLGGFISMIVDISLLQYFTCLIYLLTGLTATGIRSTKWEHRNAPGFLRNAANGFRFMRENRAFRLMTAIGFFWRLFLGLQISLFVIYVKDFLACSNTQYGIFTALIGVGSIAGSLMGPAVAKRLSPSLLIRAGLSLHYASFIAFGFCSSFPAALLLVFTSYLIFYTTLVGLHSVRDRITHVDVRGSAYGTVTAVLAPPTIVSMLAGGYLANQFGVAGVLSVAGLLALLSLHLILARPENMRALSSTDIREQHAVDAE